MNDQYKGSTLRKFDHIEVINQELIIKQIHEIRKYALREEDWESHEILKKEEVRNLKNKTQRIN